MPARAKLLSIHSVVLPDKVDAIDASTLPEVRVACSLSSAGSGP
jgi:hypothetical protein